MRHSIWSVFFLVKTYTIYVLIPNRKLSNRMKLQYAVIGMRLLNSWNFECHSFLLPRFMHHLAFLIEPCIFLKMCLCVWISHENSEKHISQVCGRFWEYLREKFSKTSVAYDLFFSLVHDFIKWWTKDHVSINPVQLIVQVYLNFHEMMKISWICRKKVQSANSLFKSVSLRWLWIFSNILNTSNKGSISNF